MSWSAAESQCIPGKLLRADVSGHYHDCAAEIRRPAVGGGQRALLKYLQKQVEHVRVRLFHLIEQYHGVGGAAHALYQLTLLLVAHISGRGAYQLGYGVLLHEFRHVEADYALLVPENGFRQRLGKFRLSNAGLSQEQERAGGTVRLL